MNTLDVSQYTEEIINESDYNDVVEIEKLETKINELQNQIYDISSTISKHKIEISDNNITSYNFQKKLENIENEIEIMKNKNDEIEIMKSELKNEIEIMRNEINELKDVNNDLNTKLSNYVDKFTIMIWIVMITIVLMFMNEYSTYEFYYNQFKFN